MKIINRLICKIFNHFPKSIGRIEVGPDIFRNASCKCCNEWIHKTNNEKWELHEAYTERCSK